MCARCLPAGGWGGGRLTGSTTTATTTSSLPVGLWVDWVHPQAGVPAVSCQWTGDRRKARQIRRQLQHLVTTITTTTIFDNHNNNNSQVFIALDAAALPAGLGGWLEVAGGGTAAYRSRHLPVETLAGMPGQSLQEVLRTAGRTPTTAASVLSDTALPVRPPSWRTGPTEQLH